MPRYSKVCVEDLRRWFHRWLAATAELDPSQRTLPQLRAQFAADKHANLSRAVMRLPNPQQGAPLLVDFLKSDNRHTALDAAVFLAVLGDASGLPVLTAPGPLPMSNSNHAPSFVKAALLMLDEPIPDGLRDQRSVFRDIDALIDRCLAEAPPAVPTR